MSSLFRISLSLMALAIAAAASAVAGDVYFEQTTVTSAGGRPGAPVATRVWHAGRKMRLQSAADGAAVILRLDRGRAFRLHPARRLAVELDLARLKERSRMDAAAAGQLMGAGPGGLARTTSLPGSRNIAGHACRTHRISAPSAVLEVCLATGLPAGIDAFAEFLEWSGVGESLEALVAELRRLRGFPLETRSRVEVLGEAQETVSTVTTFRLEPARPELFEVPAGWRVVAEGASAP